MSHENILYGRITGANGRSENWYDLYKRNVEQLNLLPQETEWPPLVRSMFNEPLVAAGPTFHRAQMITVAASLKNLDDGDLRLWLEKFESLLKKLYWFDAVVHLEMETYGKFEFRWTATQDSIRKMRTDSPQPVQEWTFSSFPEL